MRQQRREGREVVLRSQLARPFCLLPLYLPRLSAVAPPCQHASPCLSKTTTHTYNTQQHTTKHPINSYEFVTPQGLHVALSAAARAGQLYVCGVTADDDAQWQRARSAAARVVKSFRLRDAAA